MTFLASCQAISKEYGHRPLFHGITLGINEGEKIGLIGPNGAGKSTLLNILAGIETPDEGTLSSKRGLRMGYVPQSEAFDGSVTPRALLLDAIAETTHEPAERELEVNLFLAKHPFPQADTPVRDLSGGWVKRIAILRELIREPDLMLLDEPTNHLDIGGIIWLENLLKISTFAAIIVTHDRYFLENITTRIVEINPAYADGFLSVEGSYSTFLEEREAYFAMQTHREQALSSIARLEIEWLRRNPQARTIKAKGRIESAHQLLEDLDEVRTRNLQERSAGIEFTSSGRKTRELLTAKSLSKRFDDKTLFQNLDIRLSPGVKLGLLGPNGSGKTTLLRILADRLNDDSGSIKRANELKTVIFDQNRALLNQEESLRRVLSPNGETVMYRNRPIHVAGWAKRFLFSPEQLEQPVSFLSGGEQARLLIAKLMLEPADILLLDEPTNDLDIASIEALEETLLEFSGALMLVTHDRFLLERVCTGFLALNGNGGASYFSDYGQWERTLKSEKPETKAKREAKPKKPAPRSVGGLSASERNELKRIEETILSAEAEVKRLENSLTSPEVATNAEKLQRTWEELSQARERVTAVYARWEELERKQADTT
jgi:ATP-binding cassette subfamily F protein uup